MISAICFLIRSCWIFCCLMVSLDVFRSCFFSFLGLSRSARSARSRLSFSDTMSPKSLLEAAGAAKFVDDPMSSARVDAELREPSPNRPWRGRSERGVPGRLGATLGATLDGGEGRGVLLGVLIKGVLVPLPSRSPYLSSGLYSLSSVPRIPPWYFAGAGGTYSRSYATGVAAPERKPRSGVCDLEMGPGSLARRLVCLRMRLSASASTFFRNLRPDGSNSPSPMPAPVAAAVPEA